MTATEWLANTWKVADIRIFMILSRLKFFAFDPQMVPVVALTQSGVGSARIE